jgi:transposase
VKPYVKTNKNDYLDAEAIAEAVTRPTMRFVPIKSVEQLDLQTMHRIRDRMVYQRTSLISQVRSFLLEYGVVMAAGVAAFKRDLPRLLAECPERLSVTLMVLIERLREELREIEARIEEISREIEDIASRDDTARRLMSVPGIGPLGATAFLAAVGDVRRFRRARDLAAWIGLVAVANKMARIELGIVDLSRVDFPSSGAGAWLVDVRALRVFHSTGS